MGHLRGIRQLAEIDRILSRYGSSLKAMLRMRALRSASITSPDRLSATNISPFDLGKYASQ
jgi:hypothetical protein